MLDGHPVGKYELWNGCQVPFIEKRRLGVVKSGEINHNTYM